MALKKITPEELEELRRKAGDNAAAPVSAGENTLTGSMSDYGAWRERVAGITANKPGQPAEGSVLGEKTRDPYYETNRHPFYPADVAARGFLNAVTAGNSELDPFVFEPAASDKALSGLGSGLGVALSFGVGAGPAKAVAGPALSRLPAIARAPVMGSAMFGAYEAAHPAESGVERAKNIGTGVALGAGMSAIPMLPVVGKAMEKPVGNFIGNSALMTLINKAMGQSWGDAALTGIPFAAGGTAAHIAGGAAKANVAEPAKQSTPESVATGGIREPIEGVPASIPMSRFLKDKISYEEFIAELGESAKTQTGAVTEESLSAVRKDLRETNKQRKADGKNPIKVTKQRIYGMAESRSVSPEVRKQVQAGLPDVRLRETVDTRRTVNAIGNDEINTPIGENTQRLGEISQLVKSKAEVVLAEKARKVLEETGIKADSLAEEIVGRITDEIVPGETPESFMPRVGDRIINEFYPEATPQERAKIADGAGMWRQFFEDLRVDRDVISRAFTGSEFEGRKDKGYLPKEERKVSLIRSPIERIKQETEPRQYFVRKDSGASPQNPIPDAGPRRVRSSREKQRSDSEMKYPRDYRVARVVERYVADQAKRIAYQPVVSSTKGVVASMRDDIFARRDLAKELRKAAKEAEDLGDPDTAERFIAEANRINNPETIAGIQRTAEALDGVIQATYNDIHYGATGKMIDKLSVSRPGMAVLRGSRLGKTIFNMAKYKLNVPFVVLRQWSSSGQGLGIEQDVTPADMVNAFRRMWADDIATATLETYTGDRKSQRMGSMRHEATGLNGTAQVRPRSAGERVVGKVDELSDWPTNQMESLTNRFSTALGEIIADKRGWTGKTKMDFMSDITSRMQSEYHREGMAEIRRNPVANFLVPAQSFSLEAFNNLRFAKSNTQRAKLIGGMAMANAVYQYVNSYRKADSGGDAAEIALEMALDTLGATFPGSSLVTSRGPSKGALYPTALVEEVFGEMPGLVAKGMAEDDEDKANLYYERAANILIKNFVPGGGQISRAVSADIFRKRGIISDDEFDQAALFGWWTTEGGKEYLRRLTGSGEKSGGPQQRMR